VNSSVERDKTFILIADSRKGENLDGGFWRRRIPSPVGFSGKVELSRTCLGYKGIGKAAVRVFANENK
jgi:hypothetical protein